MLIWEKVDKEQGLFRAKITGGWLVKLYQIFAMVNNQDLRKTQTPINAMIGLTFVPDPNYEWKIEIEATAPGPQENN